MIHVLKLLAGLLVPVCYIYVVKFLKLTYKASKDRHLVVMYSISFLNNVIYV